MAHSDSTALQTILERVTKIDNQQDRLIGALGDMTGMVAIVSAQINEVIAWTREPASGGLDEAMTEIAAALGRINGTLAVFADQVAALNRRLG
jgi:hypothetical protein